jgi:hypothetical protein
MPILLLVPARNSLSIYHCGATDLEQRYMSHDGQLFLITCLGSTRLLLPLYLLLLQALYLVVSKPQSPPNLKLSDQFIAESGHYCLLSPHLI